MNFKTFLQKQDNIYSSIESQGKQLLLNGITPNNNVLVGEKGYLIAYKHDEVVSKKIEEISKKVAKLVPAMIYNSKDVHTTIFAQKIDFNSDFDEVHLELFNSIIKKLTFSPAKVVYDGLLSNQDSVIASGQPDKAFYKNSEKIIDVLNKKNITASLPKMAHITVSRFINEAERDQIKRLIKYLNYANGIGTSSLEKIILGTFITTKEGFNLKIFEEYNFSTK